jgi:hypothetical protein
MGRQNDPFGYFPVNPKGQMNPCFECMAETKGTHHVIPVSLGGTKVIPLCEECHSRVHGGVISGRLIREGIGAALARGVKFGAPIKATPDIRLKCLSLRRCGKTYKQIALELNISTGLISAILKGDSDSNQR